MQTHPFSSVPKQVLSLRLRERDDFAGSKQVIQGGKKKNFETNLSTKIF